jgi:hypothetical protein
MKRREEKPPHRLREREGKVEPTASTISQPGPASKRFDANAIAEALVGRVEWTDSQRGYCRCPGVQFHKNRNGKRDCIVCVDRVPTIYCVHSSCAAEIERANYELRSAISKAKFNREKIPGKCWRPSVEGKRRQCEREAYQRLKLRAEKSLTLILEKWATHPVEFFEESPVRLLGNPADDWKLLLDLFRRDDILWIGDKYDSGLGHERNFCRVSLWLTEPAAPAQFICPNTFKAGVHSRSNDNVLHHRYLVVESDTLAKTQIVAVFCWCRQFLRLRAIVDTAGKSLHGWFDYPTTAQLYELKNILPQLSCDPALFKPSQPVRLPGARRGEKVQALLYLDLGRPNDPEDCTV